MVFLHVLRARSWELIKTIEKNFGSYYCCENLEVLNQIMRAEVVHMVHDRKCSIYIKHC